MSDLRKKIVQGVFWQGLERFGNHGITFIISIILARLLTPKQFALVALSAVLITIAGTLIESGLSKALVQKKDIDEIDCNSIFFFNIVMGLLMYGLIYPLAPFVAHFYNQPKLTSLTRIIALSLIVTSFASIQRSLLAKRMDFHLSFRISWLAQIPAGIIGIFLAYKGLGVWSLVAQQLTRNTLNTALLWYFVKWRPQRVFNLSRLKKLFSFSWKLLCSQLLNTIYNDLYTLVVGKLFSLEILSFSRRGRHLPGISMSLINTTIGTVLFPAFSTIQDDKLKMRELAKRGLKNIMFLVIPTISLLFVTARPLVTILYTAKWLPSVVFLQITCFSIVITPFHTMNLQIMTACGRSDYFLYLEIFKKVEMLLLIFICYRFGIIIMTCYLAANSYLLLFVNGWPNHKLIGYPPWRQFADILPFFFIAAIGVGITQVTRLFPQNDWLLLVTNAIIFAIVYFGLATVAHLIPQDVFMLASTIKGKLISRHKN